MSLKHRRTWATAAIVTLSACAISPLQPDLAARAPNVRGFGDLRWPITTSSPAAQHGFTQGVLQAYAFNEVEAVRMFKAALAQDPRCAMCAWGVAWQLGPNINNSSRSQVPEALRYIDLALRNSTADNASVQAKSERAWIEAMALRYGHGSQAAESKTLLRDLAPLLAERCATGQGAAESRKVDPLDLAYAERLRSLLQNTPASGPQRADLITAWAEAEMIATGSAWWTGNKPAGRMGEVATALEQALVQHSEHTGLNHYLIHAVDSTDVARRAEAAADRIGRLAPGSPHLVHMPSHTYSHIGRYGDAMRVNQEAVAADLVLMDAQKAQSFTVSKDWRGHNQHFLWFAALMQGQGDVALATAREMAGRFAKATHAYGDYGRSLPVLTLLRLERWQAVLAEPVPTNATPGLAQAFSEHARGIAFLRSGQVDQARAALAKAQAASDAVANTYKAKQGFDRTLRAMASASVLRLQAELAFADSKTDEALALQTRAVEQAQHADNSEPPMLAGGARVMLADLQMRVGKPELAEATLRQDLQRQPGNGWALQGLVQALQAQGRAAEAELPQALLDDAWRQADAPLRARQLGRKPT
jgi:tetratricopeptide (TPR) repeat protein